MGWPTWPLKGPLPSQKNSVLHPPLLRADQRVSCAILGMLLFSFKIWRHPFFSHSGVLHLAQQSWPKGVCINGASFPIYLAK